MTAASAGIARRWAGRRAGRTAWRGKSAREAVRWLKGACALAALIRPGLGRYGAGLARVWSRSFAWVRLHLAARRAGGALEAAQSARARDRPRHLALPGFRPGFRGRNARLERAQPAKRVLWEITNSFSAAGLRSPRGAQHQLGEGGALGLPSLSENLRRAANVASLQHPVETLMTIGPRQFGAVSHWRTFNANRSFREAVIFKGFIFSATRAKRTRSSCQWAGLLSFGWQKIGHRSALFSPQAPAYWVLLAYICATGGVASGLAAYISETGKQPERVADCGKVTNRTSGPFRSVRGLHSISYSAGTGPHPKRRLFPKTSG